MTRPAWWRLAAYTFVVAVFIVGIWRVETTARTAERAAQDAEQAVQEVHEEIVRSEAERCRVTLLSREGSLAKDLRVWTRFGHEIEAPQDRIDEFLDGIREDYEGLPVPADCD